MGWVSPLHSGKSVYNFTVGSSRSVVSHQQIQATADHVLPFQWEKKIHVYVHLLSTNPYSKVNSSKWHFESGLVCGSAG